MRYILYAIVILFISSCGGGSSSSDTSSNITIGIHQGNIIDSYIENATVCFDINANLKCDNTEATVLTTNAGYFAFGNIEIKKDSLISIFSSKGTDVATKEEYQWTLKAISKAEVNGQYFITPFTDMIYSSYFKDKNIDNIGLVKNKLLTSFNLEESLFLSDPMRDKKYFFKTQYLESLKNLLKFTMLNKNTNIEGSDNFQDKIKLSLISGMENNSISFEKVLNYLEKEFLFSFTLDEKNYLLNQINSFKNSFALYEQDNSIELSDLQSIQKSLHEEQKLIFDEIKENLSSLTIIKNLSGIDKLLSKARIEINEIKDKNYETPPKIPAFN